MNSNGFLKNFTCYLLLGIISFLVGWFLGGRLTRTRLSPETKIIRDTLWRVKPAPLSTITIGSVPHVYFFTDTLYDEAGEVEAVIGDSTVINFPIVQRTYPDSAYYAVISGPVVGGRFPTLDSIAVYREKIITTVKGDPEPAPRWAFGPAVETGYIGRFYALTGATVEYSHGRVTFGSTAGFDAFSKEFAGKAYAKFDLFRIK